MQLLLRILVYKIHMIESSKITKVKKQSRMITGCVKSLRDKVCTIRTGYINNWHVHTTECCNWSIKLLIGESNLDHFLNSLMGISSTTLTFSLPLFLGKKMIFSSLFPWLKNVLNCRTRRLEKHPWYSLCCVEILVGETP